MLAVPWTWHNAKNVENHVYSVFLASERHKKRELTRQLIWNIGASVATSARDKKESKAKVLKWIEVNRIKVHFQGWQSKFDEWLPSA